MMVTWENYEEYMLLHVDGELDKVDEQALMEFVRLHPELKDELSAYQAAVLRPDRSMVFAGRDSLLRTEAATRVISLGHWRQYGAAAGIAALILLGVYWWNSQRQQDLPAGPEVAVHTEAPVPPQQEPEPLPIPVPVTGLPLSRQPEPRSATRNSVHSNTERLAQQRAPEPAALEPLLPAGPRLDAAYDPLPLPLPAPVPVALLEDVFELKPAVDEEKEEGLLAWVPDEKREGWQSLKRGVDERLESAKGLAENLKDKQIALKLGSRELLVINF